MSLSAKRTLWMALYFLLILAPFLILLFGPRPAGREFWREVSVALGFAGLALMGLQLIPTARLPVLRDVFAMDAVYYFHHRISLVSFYLVAAHPLLLIVNNPFAVELLNVFTTPGKVRTGVLSVIALIGLIFTSVYRQRMKLSYEGWRGMHDVFTLAVIGLALWHVLGINYYMAMPLQRALWLGLAVLWGGLALFIRVIRPWTLQQRPWRVREVIPERGRSWSVVLEPDGHPGFTFLPGQFAWLTVGRSPYSIGEHPFSLSSSAERKDAVSFTIRELGDWTATVGQIEPGTRAYIDGPFGTFSIDRHDAPSYAFLAGGIGSAPIMSMLRTLADRGDQRPVVFFYGNENWDCIMFREELEALEKTMNLKVVHVLEHPPEGWQGERGFINAAVLEKYLPANRSEPYYFMCGPPPMLNPVTNALKKVGVPMERLHTERYEMA